MATSTLNKFGFVGEMGHGSNRVKMVNGSLLEYDFLGVDCLE